MRVMSVKSRWAFTEKKSARPGRIFLGWSGFCSRHTSPRHSNHEHHKPLPNHGTSYFFKCLMRHLYKKL